MTRIAVQPKSSIEGRPIIPGDKSISHRAVMLGAIAEGITNVSGFLAGEDPLATMNAFREMGVRIEQDGTSLTIHGVGINGLNPPEKPLDIGNSGTSIRLMSGILCGQHFNSTITGDRSIRRRPMNRIIEPLKQMGAHISSADDAGHAPLCIRGLGEGERLHGIAYNSPVASAQIKSAILLAGLYADGDVEVREPGLSRDHTEQMMQRMGVRMERNGYNIRLSGPRRLSAIQDLSIPSDISSAAFFIVAGLIASSGEIVLENIGNSTTRTGVLDALNEMGADITLFGDSPGGYLPPLGRERITNMRIRPSRLRGATIGGALIPRLIDEIPALCVAACFAEGTTVIRDARELRVKETDRIATMVEELEKIGAKVEPREDGMVIHGNPDLRVPGCTFESHGDHRVAMSMALTSFRADSEITINDVACVETSFPGFFDLLAEVSG